MIKFNKKYFDFMVFVVFVFSVVILFISYKVSGLYLDKISIVLFVVSAIVNGVYWKIIIINNNVKVNSLEEAATVLNKIVCQHKTWYNGFSIPRFRGSGTLEHKFNKSENKSIAAAILITTYDRWVYIPIVLMPLLPAWFFGVDSFKYDRFYNTSIILHDTLFYLSLFPMAWFFWFIASNFVMCFLISQEVK